MFTWMMIGASCIAMSRIAELGDRSGWGWGVTTLLVCIGCAAFIPLPFVNVGVGFALTYLLMIVASLIDDHQPTT